MSAKVYVKVEHPFKRIAQLILQQSSAKSAEGSVAIVWSYFSFYLTCDRFAVLAVQHTYTVKTHQVKPGFG